MKSIVKTIKSIEWSQVSKPVVIRYILMILTIVNTILNRLGLNPIDVDNDSTYQAVSDLVTVVILIMNTWKNNSVTPEAIEADKQLDIMKSKDDGSAVG